MTTIYAVTTRLRNDYEAEEREASNWYPTREQAEVEKQRLLDEAYADRLRNLSPEVEAAIEKSRAERPELYENISGRHGDWLTEFRAMRDRVTALTFDEWYTGEPPLGTNGNGYNDTDYDIEEATLVSGDLDAAWEALIDDLAAVNGTMGLADTVVVHRHRALIEAAIRGAAEVRP